MIAESVYALCSVASIGCALLLFRSYQVNRGRLLFWSGIFFGLLAISNILLFVDLVLVPQMDLAILRNSITAVAHLVLVFGLISKPS